MGVEQSTALNIVCDNPDCPGNSLDPTDRTGWFFISSEFYGQPTQQHVFCSNTCASEAATNDDADFGTETDPISPTPAPPTPISPVEPKEAP
jgi:hypothetical protein